ncbi:hypothetical protein SALINJAH_182 [Bacillus phage SalinJah]|uniref:Uncharacterized protein n=1 Tax=Bacillus phage SalinJah TaxID=1837830 RepID=A0A173GBQ6_9CAUD|nr:hypothetical protein SALINJAH_182 [Bacillus phage SalinJah]ANH50633.1 hypothetical protein SALINJAH_182 [Bacillus phage SalinJah]
MGMYTGLRAKIVVKEEYEELAEFISCGGDWDEIADIYPFVEDIANKSRGDQVPHWSVSYMPDEWGEYNVNNFNSDTREWEMIFSIKNYDGEIQCFMHTVLTVIAEKVIYMYEHYEEWDIEKQYTIEDGVLRFVRYLDVYTREHRHTLKDNVYEGWGY